jgi:hypothetical protein
MMYICTKYDYSNVFAELRVTIVMSMPVFESRDPNDRDVENQ